MGGPASLRSTGAKTCRAGPARVPKYPAKQSGEVGTCRGQKRPSEGTHTCSGSLLGNRCQAHRVDEEQRRRHQRHIVPCQQPAPVEQHERRHRRRRRSAGGGSGGRAAAGVAEAIGAPPARHQALCSCCCTARRILQPVKALSASLFHEVRWQERSSGICSLGMLYMMAGHSGKGGRRAGAQKPGPLAPCDAGSWRACPRRPISCAGSSHPFPSLCS